MIKEVFRQAILPAKLFGIQRDKVQRQGIDTVSQASGLGTVCKNVTKMGIAPRATHFHAQHAMAGVPQLANTVIIGRRPETGPAAAGIIFFAGIE